MSWKTLLSCATLYFATFVGVACCQDDVVSLDVPSDVVRGVSAFSETLGKLDYHYQYPCELLHDYHWDVEPGKDFLYYYEYAATLRILFVNLSRPIILREKGFLYDPMPAYNSAPKESTFPKEVMESPVFKMSTSAWDAFSARFYEKYDETFTSHFKRFAYDETLPFEDSNCALSLYLGSISPRVDCAEFLAIHERETERLANARISGNADEIRNAERRLTIVDRHASIFQSRLERVKTLFEQGAIKECDADAKEEARQYADLLVHLLPGDQLLFPLCDAFHCFLGRYVDVELAADFRERVLELTNKEEILTLFSNGELSDRGRSLAKPEFLDEYFTRYYGRVPFDPERQFGLFQPVCRFDESILEISMDESVDYYRQKSDVIYAEFYYFKRSACPFQKYEEIQRKVLSTNRKIMLLVAMDGKSYREFESFLRFLPLETLKLEPEDYDSFQVRCEEETKKPLIEIDEEIVLVARVLRLVREFFDALDEGNSQIREVEDRIVARAVKSDAVAYMVANFGRELEKRDPKLVQEFMERACQRLLDDPSVPRDALQECVRYSQELEEKIL